MTNLFYAKARDGTISFDNKMAVFNCLIDLEGKKLIVKIEKEKTTRTLNQNAYYWAYLRIIANETGHTEYELHSLFKRIFLPPVFKTVLGKSFKIPASTKEMSKAEFGEYLDKIAAETNVPLPDIKKMTDLMGEYPTEKLTPAF